MPHHWVLFANWAEKSAGCMVRMFEVWYLLHYAYALIFIREDLKICRALDWLTGSDKTDEASMMTSWQVLHWSSSCSANALVASVFREDGRRARRDIGGQNPAVTHISSGFSLCTHSNTCLPAEGSAYQDWRWSFAHSAWHAEYSLEGTDVHELYLIPI